MGNRILGAVCLAVAIAMAWAAQGYVADFSYEPVGPRAFPLMLAILMGLIGAWFLVSGAAKHTDTSTPVLVSTSPLDWKSVAMVSVTVMAYGAIFTWFGFWLATTAMAVPVGMAFGGKWKATLLGGMGMGLGLYVLFDKVFDVVLPTGLLSFILGGR